MPRRDRKDWRPPDAKRAQAAAEATRKKHGDLGTDDPGAARVKRKAKGLTKLPKRLTALS